MHRIYESKGEFDFIYQLPKTIYSSVISIIFNTLLNKLALSNDSILDFKRDKEIKFISERKRKLISKLSIKFIIYFILSPLFLAIFWYYISMFCAIYRNTQLHLIKDTLISFALSLIYPFAIYLLPGWFRIPSLSDKKKEEIIFMLLAKFYKCFNLDLKIILYFLKNIILYH